MIQVEFINPIKNAERVVRSINGECGDVILTIPSIEGLATEEYVNKKVTEVQLGGDVDLSEYAKKDWTRSVLANYISRLEAEAMIDAKIELIEFPETDLSNYYTRRETEDVVLAATNDTLKKIPTKVSALENDSDFQSAEQVQAAITTALGNIGVAEEGVY